MTAGNEMTINRTNRFVLYFVLVLLVLLLLLSSADAHAQAGGLGGLQTLLDKIVDLLRNTIGKSLAVLALVIAGIGWKFGWYDMRKLAQIVVGILLIWGGPQIVDYLWV